MPPDDYAKWAEEQAASIKNEAERYRKESQELTDLAFSVGDSTSPEKLKELLQRVAERTYSPDAKPKEPVTRFWVANTLICTPGNLTTVSAQAKAGKSAAVGAMIASTFSAQHADCLGFVSENPNGWAVVHFDTEQCPFDHWNGIERTVERANAEKAPPWLRSYCLTGFSPAEVRTLIRVLLHRAAEQCGGIHSVFIDGVADAVLDVNDPTETSGLVAELLKLSITFDCPIVNIIHVNPGSEDKTRGHLGSQLERKSETNLRLKKDAEEVTVLWADKNRRAPIPKKSGPCFGWNDAKKMHVSVPNPSARKAKEQEEAKTDGLRAEAEAFWVAEGKKEFTWGELIDRIAARRELSKDGARKQLDRWRKANAIRKNAAKSYELAP